MTQTLYRIEELVTSGWVLIEPHSIKLTREQCQQQLEQYIADGYNPNTLRAVPDVG